MDILFILALVATSIIAVTFMVERGRALRWHKTIPPDVQAAVVQYRGPEDLDRLKVICEMNPSPLARLLLFAADHLDWPKHENTSLVETRARHEVSRLERGLVILETIVGIAPLLGLVGTIYGLILLFGGMNEITTEQASKFAQGISLALNATLLGLLIAIPTLVAWSYYSKKVETLTVELETLCDEFLRKNYMVSRQGADSDNPSQAAVVAVPRMDNSESPANEARAQQERSQPPRVSRRSAQI